MASKTIDEILKGMSPESRAAIEKMSPEAKNAAQQTGQGLSKKGVAEKSEYVENGRRGAFARSSEPADQMPQNQRGAQFIQQKRDEARKESQSPKAEQIKEQPNQTVIKDQDKDR